MTGRERILNHLAGRPVDRLPVMPITMMFACAQVGARYRDYCTDYRVMVEGQTRTAEKFGFDYVNTLPADISVNRINLNEQTVEGLRHKTKPIFCVQYHPEASPGPHDSTPLFAEFRELIRSR